jgi:hypothetical protein
MKRATRIILLAGAAVAALGLVNGAQSQNAMTFFVTSAGPGDGGNLGGLDGADGHCNTLATAAGATGKTWRAYLSTQGANAVNAKDRIGRGPWQNAKGTVIATSVADLHSDNNKIIRANAYNEKGELVKMRGDTPNMHDMLTGSDSSGRLVPGNAALTTCNNWTSNAAGNAMLGHHDRLGGPNASWNSVHSSRSCSQPDLVATGGAGLFYCFAVE